MFAELSISGWIDGLTAMAIVVSSLIFGILSIIKGAKNKSKLLVFAGVNALFIGSYWLGPLTDFLWYGFFDNHIILELYPLLSYSQLGFGVIIVSIIGGELVTPNYKNAVIGAMSALGMMYFILVYTWVWAMSFNIPYFSALVPWTDPMVAGYDAIAPWVPFRLTPGTETELIDAGLALWNPVMMLTWVFNGFIVVFMIGGFLIKAKQSMGDLRKKFIILSIAFFIFFSVGIVDSIFSEYDLLVTIARIAMCSFAPLSYLGLRD